MCKTDAELKDPLTAFFDVSIQAGCNDVILGCTGQAIEVRWLTDATRLLFCRHVTNIPLVTLALAHAELSGKCQWVPSW